MRTYATAQQIGDRTHQCDATAYAKHSSGAEAYVILDGIGSTDEVRDWTLSAADRLAQTAARLGDAEAGLRAEYERYAAEPARSEPWASDDLPHAAAVVAVTAPEHPLTVAWCGDSRAYLLTGGTIRCLTNDHNLRRTLGGNRNLLTSCLGASETDQEVENLHGHPAIESTTCDGGDSRLLLASDGAYEPLEDSCCDLAAFLTGAPGEAARGFVEAAIERCGPHADNATALIADLS
ncbi:MULTISPECIES: PP2C family serine/threonine-protein phosphatase [unclassified Streptomyces]|uniref:PP2C family protein-serine/threonine phosphatase n=1 Tax=unclassified Streptomyces TaxID=2593676 RepID=UPI000DDAE597|nr:MULTISPECIES: mucin-2 [unclassified Streptomyces]QZZ26541.1 mucin-2 [Streptomyces sp. ST1015]